jgi:hypothetical protein
MSSGGSTGWLGGELAQARDACRDNQKPPPGRSGDGFFLARDLRNRQLPPHPNAIDATI